MFKAISDFLAAFLDLVADKALPLCSVLSYIGLILLVGSLGLGIALPALPFALHFKGLILMFLIGRYAKPVVGLVKDDLVAFLAKF
jgi:hypothetical protein